MTIRFWTTTMVQDLVSAVCSESFYKWKRLILSNMFITYVDTYFCQIVYYMQVRFSVNLLLKLLVTFFQQLSTTLEELQLFTDRNSFKVYNREYNVKRLNMRASYIIIYLCMIFICYDIIVVCFGKTKHPMSNKNVWINIYHKIKISLFHFQE